MVCFQHEQLDSIDFWNFFYRNRSTSSPHIYYFKNDVVAFLDHFLCDPKSTHFQIRAPLPAAEKS